MVEEHREVAEEEPLIISSVEGDEHLPAFGLVDGGDITEGEEFPPTFGPASDGVVSDGSHVTDRPCKVCGLRRDKSHELPNPHHFGHFGCTKKGMSKIPINNQM